MTVVFTQKSLTKLFFQALVDGSASAHDSGEHKGLRFRTYRVRPRVNPLHDRAYLDLDVFENGTIFLA